jgi:hypothetical protein
MRIPDAQLKAVGYVCETTHRDGDVVYGDPYATGFFVSVPCTSPELSEMETYYFVTAKHVANDLIDRDIHFTVNRKDGNGTTHEIHRIAKGWYLHPTDKNADVALIQVALKAEVVDLAPISVKEFGLPPRLQELNIGIGDEVHSIGLFSAAPGNERNTPIVRFGNVSMMPAEQVQTELGFTEMYLVEARSIGGMSGSPVFVRPTLGLKIPRSIGPPAQGFLPGTGETLLGMAQGHWDIKEEEINKSTFTHDSKRGVNYGIALVVPAFKIYETLYQSGLVMIRKYQEEAIIKTRRNIPGSDSPRADREGKAPFTQADFEAALRKASRKKA